MELPADAQAQEDAGKRLKVLNQARAQASELMLAIEDQLDR